MSILRKGFRIISKKNVCQLQLIARFSDEHEPVALRNLKQKSKRTTSTFFVDSHVISTKGGNGGDGCISFLQLFKNDKAGPDGGDGGNGGHVIFRASDSVSDLHHLTHSVKADDGGKGENNDCHGKNANHLIIDVPVGSVIKSSKGVIVGDLKKKDSMFIAARGGSGGRGNHYFATDVRQAPEIAEIGGEGENLKYLIEIRSMAHFGLVGLPNAGKSTFLRAISRARPEVAGYEFTTLRPHVGVVEFSDYEQIHVADLPGLIEGSHRNEGLGIEFLKHAERCLGLLYIIDLSRENPLSQLDTLQNELSLFSMELLSRPSILIGNKIDLKESQENLKRIQSETDTEIIPIAAKTGQNLKALLQRIRKMYDEKLESPGNEETD